ncbi:CHAD domain-containing protein [Thiorhodococcus mannitoliphagus]|nr:CHAD domain-containing protein [Thiorhodococcus mannitoliphagus]
MEYLIPDGLATEALEREIQEHLFCRVESAGDSEIIYYDTFDWALYSDGGFLTQRGDMLRWTSRRDGTACSQQLEAEPELVRDLPAGPVRARLPSGAENRRLLPMMRIQTKTRLLRMLDENEKTVVRLLLQSHSFEDPLSGRAGSLAARLRLEGVRGYDKERELLRALIEGKLGLGESEGPLLGEALRMVGRVPGDYSSKLDLRLDGAQRADVVTKQILSTLLVTLEANIQGAIANWDSEFLHDLRVATRRTRSALSQIKAVFPEDVVGRFKGEFAWVQQVTGPVRDLDVYLLAFDDYQASLPPELRSKLEPLRDFLLAHYEREQARLAEALQSESFKTLLGSWRDFLQRPVPSSSVVPSAMQPIKAVADGRIRSMAKRVRAEGRAIRDDSHPEELHELRKRCKNLRYLMEFFRSLYPAAQIKPLIKQLKVLLDHLGAYQDLAVQAHHLEDMAEQMQAEGRATPATLLAMGALVGGMLQRQQAARDGFAEVFAAFDDAEHWAQYRALFWTLEADKSSR